MVSSNEFNSHTSRKGEFDENMTSFELINLHVIKSNGIITEFNYGKIFSPRHKNSPPPPLISRFMKANLCPH